MKKTNLTLMVILLAGLLLAALWPVSTFAKDCDSGTCNCECPGSDCFSYYLPSAPFMPSYGGCMCGDKSESCNGSWR